MNRLILLTILGFALFWAGFAALVSDGPNDLLFDLINLMAFLVIWAAAWVTSRNKRILTTLTLLAVFVLINSIGRAGFFIIFREEAGLIWYFSQLTSSDLLAASMWNALFNLSLVVGYAAVKVLSRRDDPVPAIPPEWPVGYRAAIIMLVFLAFAGVALYVRALGIDVLFSSAKRAALSTSGERRTYGEFLVLVTPMLTVYLLVLARSLFDQGRGKSWWLVVTPLALFLVWWAFFRSIRGEILLLLIASVQVYAAAGRRMSIPQILLLFVGAGVLVSAMSAIRAELTGETLAYTSGSSFLYSLTRPFFGEFNLGGPVALWYSMLVVPSVLPYSFGSTFLQFLWLLIPRAIWTSKPDAVGEMWLSAIYPETALRFGGGMATGLPGEAVLAYGAIGLVVVALVFGAVLAWVDKRTQRARTISALVLWILLQLYLVYSSYGYYFSKGIVDWAYVAVPLLLVRSVIAFPAKVLLAQNRRHAQNSERMRPARPQFSSKEQRNWSR